MKKIINVIFKDLFWTYVPVALIVIMACVFVSFFPEVWGKLTIGWIILTFIFIWKVN